MKSLVFFSIILVALAGFAASKKTKKSNTVNLQLSGEWTGNYSIEPGPFVNPITFAFGPGQKLEVTDGPKEWGEKARGEYNLINDTLVAKYKYENGLQENVVVKAYFNRNTGKLEGNWGWVRGKGKFILEGKDAGAQFISQNSPFVK